MGLTKLALTRPIFIFMVMAACFLLGFRALTSMRVEENPPVEFGVISIATVYPGAGPEELNTLVSRRVEEAVSGVNGLYEVTATSQEGVSVVVCRFDIGTDMNTALNDVRSKVDTIVNDLPDGALKPTIDKTDTSASPVVTLALKSKELNPQQLRDLADEKLKDRFAQIKGVAGVFVNGGDVREIQLQVRKDKLLAYGVGVSDIVNAIRQASLNVPSGRVVEGGRETSVRLLGEFKTVDEIREMRIKVQDPQSMRGEGQIVRLADIVDVKDTVEERRSWSRLNGEESVVINILKIREGNAVEISKASQALVTQLQTQYPIEFTKTFDNATTITESILDLQIALFFGIFLVTLIVFIFLHDIRGTIIVAIAIPVCIAATFVAMQAFGFTINNMSMLALSLAIGVLVDDAIVVLENIYRHLKMGEDPYTAAINGRGEIGLAAIAITLADVVVFLPVGTMGGIVGQFFKPLGIGFAVCVLLSLLVSFTITPLLAARWYSEGEDVEHPRGRFAQWFDRMFAKFERFYGRCLNWALNHRWFVFISGFIALITTFMFIAGGFAPSASAAIQTGMGPGMMVIGFGVLLFVGNLIFRRKFVLNNLVGAAFFTGILVLGAVGGHLYKTQYKKDDLFKFSFAPSSDQGRLTANIELAAGTSLAETERVLAEVEKVILKHPDVKYVVGSVGSRGGGQFSTAEQGTNYASASVTLHEKAALLDAIMFWNKHDGPLRRKSDSSVAADLLESIGRKPGTLITVNTLSGFGFGKPIQMSFASDNRELLDATVAKIRDGLESGAIEGVITPELSSKPGKPELRAIPDRIRLADYGMSAAEVGGVLRTLYQGDDTPRFRVQGQEYVIRTLMSEEDRNVSQNLSEVPIRFVNGNPVFITDVATLEEGRSFDKIDRRNRSEEVRVEAGLLPGFAAGSVQGKIDAWLKKENMVPEGVAKIALGEADAQARESVYLMSALGLGLILVYMLLASLFNNLLYPFIIQLAQPQALVGALLALVLTDKAMNIVSFIGIITLVGLVGKNAILLVDYTNTLRSRGKARREAIIEAGPTRLRPIMMTSIAVVLGMLPTALAIGRGSEFRETLGITIIGGVTLSTVMTLLVIPCSYTILDDLSEFLQGRVRRKKRSPQGLEILDREPVESTREDV